MFLILVCPMLCKLCSFTVLIILHFVFQDLQPVYYLITNKPVTITCEAYDVKRISFICGVTEVEDVTVLARVEQQTRSNGQSEPVNVLEASVNVSKEKVENYEAGKEYTCNCLAHYFVSGEEKIINGSKTVVKIACKHNLFHPICKSVFFSN